jgi:DNA-binding transcriptional LysR family regulator
VELRQLEHFVTVAETLNFRAAADRLHMTQPPLSVSIRRLEEEIGAPLFIRNTHRVRLSPVGVSVLDDARRALHHAAEVRRVADATGHGIRGVLRLGFVGSAKNALLPRVLPEFRSQYPDVALHCEEQNNTQLLERVEANDLDVAVIRVPVGRRREVESVVVERDVFVVALPAQHPLARQHSIRLVALADEPFIDYTSHRVPGLHLLAAGILNEAAISPPVAQEAEQVQTVTFLVGCGLGFALVPSTAAYHPDPAVAFRPLDPRPTRAHTGLAVAWNPAFETEIIRRFRELAELAAISPQDEVS